ncbi:Imm1 family immunity protein [Catellatospora sp. IY07-71]|uniref:Imm1 family immunity protein n=1 Tax=Catellatospora sp. IY07-71 TaxID=2728827 RepID=UPI001BB3872D|nr:Imm1 family immunity protein [Catellatospora sp. IY07-71]
MVATLIFLVPQSITRDPMFRLSFMVACLVVLPQWAEIKQAAADRAAAAGERRHPAVNLPHHLFRESPYRLVNGLAASSLAVCAVLRWLVPGDWARGWYALSSLVILGIMVRTQARSGAAREGTGAAVGTTVREPLAAQLTWAEGTRSREVTSAAELRELLWQLHHEAAGRSTSADLVPPGVPRAVISLGEPDSMVLTLPEGGPPQVAVAGPTGVAGVTVTYTDDREAVFPPGSEIPIDVAIEALCAYLTAGELPRASDV